MRTCRAIARAPGSTGASPFTGIAVAPKSSDPCICLATTALAVVLLVTLERAGQSELAELVPDHGLGDEHRVVLAPVVHGDRVPEHVGDDRRAPGPGLDDVLRVLLVLDFHLLDEVVVDERALLQAARHLLTPVTRACGWRSGGERSACRSPGPCGGYDPRAYQPG